MLAADRLIDMGPGPGERGGSIVFDGLPEAIKAADTLTGAYLGARKHVSMGIKRMVTEATPRLILEGVREHNLKNVTVEFPLQHLVCVTGVGLRQGTIMQDVLFPALSRHFANRPKRRASSRETARRDWLTDWSSSTSSDRAEAARSTGDYVGAFDEIRKLSPTRRWRYWLAAGGCSASTPATAAVTCGGSGFEHVEMQFLSDVYLRCPDCDGRRYRPELLEVKIDRRGPDGQMRELSVADVLELTVSEAVQLFAHDREVIRVLQPIVDVGLEYVKLGQPVPTLSGGEAQRLKLAGFSAEAAQGAARAGSAGARARFHVDEPTTGLHFDDIPS
jgi:excinuclease ABC subunit A